MRRFHRFVMLAIICCGFQACALWTRRSSPEAELSAAVAGLASEVARLAGDQEVALLGLRDQDGQRTAATRLLDEYLVSALLRAGVHLKLVEEKKKEKKWDEATLFPAEVWKQVAASRLLVGRLQADAPWIYVRIFEVARSNGAVLGAQSTRLAERTLQRQVARQSGAQAQAEAQISVELHVLGLRDEGGISRQIELSEGAYLEQGDRLQLRFKSRVDCDVYAFLYTSKGAREDIFKSQFIYRGVLQYAPGEERWFELDASGEVYTLYFIAARRLDEDKSALFENMARPIREEQVDRFEGIDKLDGEVVSYLRRQLEGEAAVSVLRGPQGIVFGKEEKFILPDGTLLESRPEELSAAPVLVRALSFAVQ